MASIILMLAVYSSYTGICFSDNFNTRLGNAERKIFDMRQQINNLQNDVRSLTLENRNLQSKVESGSRYCQLLADDICGACECKDDSRLQKKYYCDCQNLQPKRDCLEFKLNGMKVSGVYQIRQGSINKVIQVYCDQETDGGGWTVIQRRVDGSVNFFRGWTDYEEGFGDVKNEFWLGNENLFTLSLQGMYPRGNEIRIDMKNHENIQQHAKYSKFQVGNKDRSYSIFVSGYTGTATDGLSSLDGLKFSTFDNDNDKNSASNCAYMYGSGWWFNNCHVSNLNGKYFPGGKMSRTEIASGIHWSQSTSFNNHIKSLLFTEMKMRRRL